MALVEEVLMTLASPQVASGHGLQAAESLLIPRSGVLL